MWPSANFKIFAPKEKNFPYLLLREGILRKPQGFLKASASDPQLGEALALTIVAKGL